MPQTIAHVRLTYAYEDAIRLADDLVEAKEFDLASRARELATSILERREPEEDPLCGGVLLHSVRVD